MVDLLPPRDAAALVGREHELATLRDGLDAAFAGHGGLVLIGGEAGTGKTALAEMVCREARARGALVLVGRCYDLTETPPYGPWVELFARYTAVAEEGAAGVLALPPAFARHAAHGGVAGQDLYLEQMQRFLAAIQRPLVLLLDDLQWSDRESLDLLRRLARTIADLPLLLLVTYRSDELTRRNPLTPLIPQLVREAAAVRADLHPLDGDAVRLLVTGRYGLGEVEAAELVRYLQGRAEGNALFVGELLRTLEEAGMLRREGDHWALGDLAFTAIPPLLRQVIGARVDRLGEEARPLLGAAALIGQEVPYAVWAAVAQTDEATLLALVERAEAARVMEEAPDGTAARFAHALIREALFEDVRPSQRRRLHRGAGEILAAAPFPDPDAVAYHFRHAGDPRAAEWLVRAGNRARASYALVTAAERYAAALDLLDEAGADPGERAWLTFRLARAQWLADPDRALRHLDDAASLAEAAGDRGLRAGIRFLRGFLLCMRGEMRRGIAELEAAVPAIAALPEQDRARMDAHGWDVAPERVGLLPEWLAWTGRFDDALAAAEPILREVPEAGAAPARSHQAYADAYLGLAVAHAGKGEPDEARRAWEAARSFNLSLDHAHQIGMNAFQELNWSALAFRADRPDERRALADEAEAAWRRAGGAGPDVVPEAPRLLPLLVEGRWDEARAIAIRTHAARSSGWSREVPNRVIAEIARARGRADEAWARATETLADGPDTAPGNSWILDTLPLLRLAAQVAIDRSDLTTAGAWLRAHDRWLASSGAVLGEADGQLLWARYYRQAGDPDRARAHAARSLADATDPRQPLALLAAHRFLGELDTAWGRFADADAHLAHALSLADACAAPYERALTMLALAELHAATGDRARSASALDEARAICERLGARPALAWADRVALRNAAADDLPQSHPAGLSDREVEVLRLVAAGKTNREIAAILFLAPGTVNIHVTHILAKTESANRVEAAAFALRHGLA